jgi:hypothetical protein
MSGGEDCSRSSDGAPEDLMVSLSNHEVGNVAAFGCHDLVLRQAQDEVYCEVC